MGWVGLELVLDGSAKGFTSSVLASTFFTGDTYCVVLMEFVFELAAEHNMPCLRTRLQRHTHWQPYC
jgi:hypothetical protein